MTFLTHTLSNGIRLIHFPTPSPVAHCGFFIHTGSRDESAAEIGMAHCAEHLFFKATRKRNTYQILSRMEDVGGDLDAYTTKEETCIQTTFMTEHYARAFELIADIIFHYQFRPQDLEKELEVIADEISTYRDTPSENIFDDFDALIFRDHPLGHPILGTKAALRHITTDKLDRFVSTHYYTDRMVMASVGSLPFRKICTLFERFFGHIPAHLYHTDRMPFTDYQAGCQEFKKRNHQGHCVIGTTGYSLYHPGRLRLILLTNMLGGPGMNTRLNMALREHKGLSYSVEAAYTPYTDTGVSSLYFSSERAHIDQCIDIVQKELKKLREVALGTMQLHRAQQQLIGQVAISSDSNENQMLSIGKSFMVYDKVDTLPEITAQIRAITSSELLETAREIWDPDRLSTLIYR